MTEPAISDEQFLRAIRETTRIRGELEGREWSIGATRWDLTAYLAGHPEHIGGTPQDYPNLTQDAVLERARDAIRRGLIEGCDCGCELAAKEMP